MKWLFIIFISSFVSAQELTRSEIMDLIIKMSGQYNIDSKVMLAQAMAESGFNPLAINKTEKTGHQSMGLFQIQTTTANGTCGLNPKEIMNIHNNIKCASIITSKNLIKYKGDYVKTVFAYNAGGYYVCGSEKSRNGECILGFPVNAIYLAHVVKAYTELLPEFRRLKLVNYKPPNFLALSKKYIDR